MQSNTQGAVEMNLQIPGTFTMAAALVLCVGVVKDPAGENMGC